MHNDTERVLAEEETITPSAGFLTSVMDAVKREVEAPPPIAFPWFRALPGLLATIAALTVAIWRGIDSLNDPVANAAFDEQVRQFTALAMGLGLQWVTLAAAMTIVPPLLASSLTRGRNC